MINRQPRRKRTRLTPEQVEAAALRIGKASLQAIADGFGCAASTLHKALKRAGHKNPRRWGAPWRAQWNTLNAPKPRRREQ